ncbi:MAG: 23S rRNA (guanosine(2251)-2'-O)-methyltransferase RlmB [Candidatus Binatia bacterium]
MLNERGDYFVASEEKFLFLFGFHPVMEKLKGSPQEVVEVLITRGRHRDALRSLEKEASRLGLPIRYVESQVLDRLAGRVRHQGVGAKVLSYTYSDFADLIKDLRHSAGHNWILVLDGVTDPRNLGSLLRTAEGMGIHDVIIPRDRSVGVTPTVVKTSAGAALHLRIYRVTNLRRAILELKGIGYWVIGLHVGGKEVIFGRSYPEKLVVVVGSEGAGIRPLIRQECDFLTFIPMRGKITSLNVSVSAGIFLYELVRQRTGI